MLLRERRLYRRRPLLDLSGPRLVSNGAVDQPGTVYHSWPRARGKAVAVDDPGRNSAHQLEDFGVFQRAQLAAGPLDPEPAEHNNETVRLETVQIAPFPP